MVVCQSALGSAGITANGRHIPEEGKIEAQNLKIKQMYNRSTELEHSTKALFWVYAVICCAS
jgi:hypothetical protein